MMPWGSADVNCYSLQYSLSAYYVGGAVGAEMIQTLCSLMNSEPRVEDRHLMLSPEKSLLSENERSEEVGDSRNGNKHWAESWENWPPVGTWYWCALSKEPFFASLSFPIWGILMVSPAIFFWGCSESKIQYYLSKPSKKYEALKMWARAWCDQADG